MKTKAAVVGDVVRLKSDGPWMTVKSITTNASFEEQIRCVWFVNGELNEDDFIRAALVKKGS